MANEDKKDFNAMLQDNKDMPKFQIITDVKSIEKYGGNKMYFAPPIAYDEVMKKIPYGKVITVGKIREFFAKENDADFTEPITAGIFVSIAAWASHQRLKDKTPYWRTLKAKGELNEKYPGGIQKQKEKLEEEVQRITNWNGFDVTIEAVGLPSTFQNCIDCAAYGGRVVLIGVGKKNLDFNFTIIQKKELEHAQATINKVYREGL